MSDALGDDGTKTSPAWDTFDPSEITGASFRLDIAVHGTVVFRSIAAPNVALGGDAPYVLVFKTPTALTGIPGTSRDVDGWLTRNFAAGEVLLDTQISEIKKDGSTAGAWEVWI